MGPAGDQFAQMVETQQFVQSGALDYVQSANTKMLEWNSTGVHNGWNELPITRRAFAQTCIQIIMRSAGVDPLVIPEMMIKALIAIWVCAIWMYRHYPAMVTDDPLPQQSGPAV